MLWGFKPQDYTDFLRFFFCKAFCLQKGLSTFSFSAKLRSIFGQTFLKGKPYQKNFIFPKTLFLKGFMMRRPGFEPGQWAWKAQVIPLDHRRFLYL